jgi:hypothetical protein
LGVRASRNSDAVAADGIDVTGRCELSTTAAGHAYVAGLDEHGKYPGAGLTNTL